MTEGECRERLYEDEHWGAYPNEKQIDVPDTSLDRVYYYDDGSRFGDEPEYLGVLDDRAVTPESLRIAQNQLQDIADELNPAKFLPPTKKLILIAISEGVDESTRAYIEEQSKFTGGDSHYIFVVDCPAKSIVYNEYSGWGLGHHREDQAEIANTLYELIQ